MTGHPPITPERLRAWGRHTYGSPLYARLVEVVAGDPELIRIINRIEHQPRPNMLFAAVHYLLLSGVDHPLARFYPSLAAEPEPLRDVDPVFRDFVAGNEEEIVEIGRTRYTQTNECRRCVALVPAMWAAPFGPFHLVELGAAAGLNLAFDHYHYRWGGIEWGPASPVELVAESRGEPPRPRAVQVLSRTGVDLRPVDPSDPDQRLWLEALIWPEHHERRLRLAAALEVAAGVDIDLIKGDFLELLPAVLESLPAGEPAVVVSSFVLVQLTEAQRQELEEVVAAARRHRPLHRVSFELLDKTDPAARLRVDDGSGWEELAQAHPHGEWVEFYARP
ncbi:MAG: DUF2332 domain-containing protein [Acidimicrobiia bacterium]